MSHQIHHTDAFVLGAIPSGEANKVVLLLTEELGFIRAVATSVRVEKSKLRYSLQPYCWSRVALVRGRDIWRVTGADIQENTYSKLREKELERGMIVRIAALLRRLLHGEGRNDELYSLLAHITHLTKVEEHTEHDIEAFECIAVMRILMSLGYMPARNVSFLESIQTNEINKELIAHVAPHRTDMILLINESLEATQL